MEFIHSIVSFRLIQAPVLVTPPRPGQAFSLERRELGERGSKWQQRRKGTLEFFVILRGKKKDIYSYNSNLRCIESSEPINQRLTKTMIIAQSHAPFVTRKKRPPRNVRYVNMVYVSARRRGFGSKSRNLKSMDEEGGERGWIERNV